MISISTTVDGAIHSDDVEPRMLLVKAVRAAAAELHGASRSPGPLSGWPR